jgi:PD-(D/E)XK nuclease superfamily
MTDAAKVFLLETKTSSENIEPGSSFWKRTVLDPQLSLYLPALRTMGHDPRGCVYDVLRKPDLEPYKATPLDKRKYTKPTKKDPVSRLYAGQHETDETPESYRGRCLEAIGKRPEKYYARGLVVRLESDEREAAADVWQTASQMRESKRLNIYPRNPDSCFEWSRDCDYLNVCSGIMKIDDPLFFKHESANAELGGDDLSLLSQSAMRAYRKCQRKYYFRYVLRQRTLKKAETLGTGTSIHQALDVYRTTGGDLEAAKKALLTEDLFVRAKEEAMLIGYAARWGKPTGIVAVEQQFQIDLINPDTGGVSRTYTLGGRVDAIVSAESAQDLINPLVDAPPPVFEEPEPDLETQLRLSVEANETSENEENA